MDCVIDGIGRVVFVYLRDKLKAVGGCLSVASVRRVRVGYRKMC